MTDTTPTPLSIQDILLILKPWEARHKALTAQFQAYQTLTGADHDSPLWSSVYDVWTGYTHLVSEAVGDRAEWLSYFECECDMGASPKEVSWSVDGVKKEVVTLNSIEALAYVLTH